MKSRSDLYREAFADEEKRMKSIHEINGEYKKLLEFARNNKHIAAQEQPGDTSLAAVLIRYIESLETEFYAPLQCDYCEAVVDDPWHGSGTINGKTRRHIHACDNCRHLLPTHGMKYVWCNIAGNTEHGGFSNSWDAVEAGSLSPEELKKHIDNNPELNSYKLIEYRCLSDENFVFDYNMKLR